MSISLTSILHFNWSSITICVLLTSKRHAWVPIDKFYWMYIYCGYNVHMSWWFVVHILLSAMCTTYPSIIHFRLEFDDYPLPDSYRDNWKKYRLIIAVECRDTVSSTYSSQPKKNTSVHVRDIWYYYCNTSFPAGIQTLSLNLIISDH